MTSAPRDDREATHSDGELPQTQAMARHLLYGLAGVAAVFGVLLMASAAGWLVSLATENEAVQGAVMVAVILALGVTATWRTWRFLRGRRS